MRPPLFFALQRAPSPPPVVDEEVIERVRCLVTGASGFLGRPLVAALAGQGYIVDAVCRKETSIQGAQRMLQGDLRDPGFVDCGGVHCLFHLAGIAHQQATAADYLRINVEATLELARIAKASGVKRFVFVSSVKALPLQSPTTVSTNISLPQENHPNELDYGQSKALAEEGLRALCSDAEMELAIIRPALVYSLDALGHLAWLRRWTELRLPAPPAGGARSMIAREDLVRLLLCLADPQLQRCPTSMTVTDGERYSVRRLHAALCRYSGSQPVLASPPPMFWRATCSVFDRLRGAIAGSTWRRLVGEETYPSSGFEEFGFQPQLTFERSLGLELP